MSSVSEQEKELLAYWEKNSIFERSVQERPEDRLFTFYDGPPFATGLPHYGHIIASLMKDVVPRYWTMKGFRVRRVWGWDCHGLPIENIIEAKLNLKSKKDIEELGIAQFNEACRSTVLEYAEEWKKTIQRMGRWVDMEHAYMTMDASYMESVWWVFSELWKKGLVYEGKKAMHICPRCVTPLSNFEVTLGYKEITDVTAIVKFHLKPDQEFGDGKYKPKESAYILAWTTTPWTLPGNVALAVGKDIKYTAFRIKGIQELFIVASDLVESVTKDKEIEIVHNDMVGSDLVGLAYEPLFPYFKDTQNAFRVVTADFVSTQEGTGVVHIAPAFGEDDYTIGQRENIGFVQHVTMQGKFTPEVSDFSDCEVKPKEVPSQTDEKIIAFLHEQGALFLSEKYTHSYPHCWRCDTPLLNYATSSWFIRVTALKDQLLSNNLKTHWVPDAMRDGRFGVWLQSARDWAVSRNRYWGTPLPIWKSEDGDVLCVGSIQELEKLSGTTVPDLHKHHLDDLKIIKDGKEYIKIPEVLDCWFESGAMPYAQMHYPFEHKKEFEDGFPAQFIAEGQDQTRGWFYTLHVLATALSCGDTPSIQAGQSVPAFLNVVVNGIVLAEDGKKMAKRLKNYPDPLDVIERYGADAIRYYLVTSPAMHAENLNFSETGVREMYNKCLNTLSNVCAFYCMFHKEYVVQDAKEQSAHVLDRWILSRLETLVREVTEHMEKYELAEASRPIHIFVGELSQWYVRRSRERLKNGSLNEKNSCLQTLHEVLDVLSRVCAPFIPFLAEKIYRSLYPDAPSVHLERWPELNTHRIDKELETTMEHTRSCVEVGHALRAEGGIKVRQPLSEMNVSLDLGVEFFSLIADEVNVKKVSYEKRMPTMDSWKVKKEKEFEVALCCEIDSTLQKEGMIREVTRLFNAQRKELGLTIQDRISVRYTTEDTNLLHVLSEHTQDISKAILADVFEEGTTDTMDELIVGGEVLKISIQKI